MDQQQSAELDARLRAADPMAGVQPDLNAIRARICSEIPTSLADQGQQRRAVLLRPVVLAAAASVFAIALTGGWVWDQFAHPRASLGVIITELSASCISGAKEECQDVVVTNYDCARSDNPCNDVVIHKYTAAGGDTRTTVDGEKADFSPGPMRTGSIQEPTSVERMLPYLAAAAVAALLGAGFIRRARRRSRRG